MKIEPIAEILKILKPILTLKTVLYTSLVVAVAFWMSFLFPQVFAPLKLDTWRADNDTLIGLGVIASSMILFITLLVNLDNWISARLRGRRDKRFVRNLFRDLFRDLSSSEMQYLYQFIWHKTLIIEFDETDPVVGLLQTKGIIFPSPRVYLRLLVRYKCRFDEGEPFSIEPTVYEYLTEHPQLLGNAPPREAS
jgi:hypothetical protein